MEHIDEYMSGKMNAEDKAAFEQAMLTDADLRNLVENYHEVRKVATGILEAELLSQVQGVTQGAAAPQPKVNANKKYLLVAALLLALAAAIFWLTQTDTRPDDEKTEILAYWPQPLDENNTRSSDTELSDEFEITIAQLKSTTTLADTITINYLDQAKQFYHLNELEKSSAILEALLTKTANVELIKKINYWLGHTYFKLGLRESKAEEYKKAQQIFQKLQHFDADCMVQLCAVYLGEQSMETLNAVCRKE